MTHTPAPSRQPRYWRRWVLLTLGLALVYLAAWPLVWRLVIVPAASSTSHGLRTVVTALDPAERRRPHGLLAGPQELDLDQPHSKARGIAIWRVPAEGTYALRLEADDYASLRLDRRLLIDMPQQASDLNSGQNEVRLEAGAHLLQVSLTNLEGRGWLRLLVRPQGQEQWQPLAREQLSPVDLGNLDMWLGLVAWLEGLCVWGLLGALLIMPVVAWRGSVWSDRIRRGLVLLMLGLPVAMAVARAWPAALSVPWLTTYSPDLRLPVLGLAFYALVLAAAAGLVQGGLSRRALWWCLVLLMALTRVYAWPYSMHCGLHPDWTSFAGYYQKFYDLFLVHGLDRDFYVTQLLAYLSDVGRNFYAGYPSGCFSFPAILLGLGAMAAQTALWGTGAAMGFDQAGHLLGPAFNLAYALLLAAWASRHLREPGQEFWPWLLLLLLSFVPLHIYLGANITYNLLADALHLALLLAGLELLRRWQDILGGQALASQAPWQVLWRPGLLLCLLLGLCLATKIVFIPALLTMLLYTGALMWRHRGARPALVWAWLPGSLLAVLAGGGLVYGLMIIRNVLNVPEFWGQMTGMASDNTGISLARASLGQCLRAFFGGLLVPNLGYAGTVAGGLGLALWAWRAIKGRDLARLMVVVWVGLTVALNLLSWSMLLMFNAMPRSSMLMGLWLALALYLAASLWRWLSQSLGRRGSIWLKAILALAVGLETALAGGSLLVMYGAGAPRHQSEAFLGTLAGGQQSVAGVTYLTYSDDPNTLLGHKVVYRDLRGHLHGLSTPQGRQRFISEASADYWLLTSYEAFFLGRGEEDLVALKAELEQNGYVLRRRLESRPFAGHTWLQVTYEHFIWPLMADSLHGGLQEPRFVEVFGRSPANGQPFAR